MAQKKRSVLSIIGFVLGVLSILSLGIMSYGYLTLILGVVAIVVNIIALIEIKMKKRRGRVFAIIGIILGLIAMYLASMLFSVVGSIPFG